MLKPMVRSLVSVVVAGCFALSATSWGRPLDCAAHSPSSGHQGPQDRSHHHGQPPAGQVCAVHLCCAHVSPPARATPVAERLGEVTAARGLVGSTTVLTTRSAHTLPFAQAPPLLS